MSCKTLEVELENGHVRPRDSETLPAKAHALLTLLDSSPPPVARTCSELAERCRSAQRCRDDLPRRTQRRPEKRLRRLANYKSKSILKRVESNRGETVMQPRWGGDSLEDDPG
jgi:hypothetical protein